MHNAPPVVFPVGRFVWSPWVVALLMACSAWGLLWGLAHADIALQKWAWLGWGALVLLAIWVSTRDHWAHGFLVWTGDTWWWRDAQGRETETPLQVVVDMGFALGLALKPVGVRGCPRSRFVWLQRRHSPQLWHGFRCAVYARPKAAQAAPLERNDVL
jgi:hypothetical protein